MIAEIKFSPERYGFAAVVRINGGHIEILGKAEVLTHEQRVKIFAVCADMEDVIKEIIHD